VEEDDNYDEALSDAGDASDASEDGGEENDLIAWKKDLAEKASESFYERQSNVTSLRKLVYGTSDAKAASGGQGAAEDDDDAIGGMFRILSEGQARKSSAASVMDLVSHAGLEAMHILFGRAEGGRKLWGQCYYFEMFLP
jgi:hypothetical protein